jgi:LmbE family N-acetylglucosaminyl deacetylase
MRAFKPELPPGATVLCIGAHCDDIEIGCGGALMELQARQPDLKFHWVVFSADDVREPETRAAVKRLLGDGANVKVEMHRFRQSYFPNHGAEIKDAFEDICRRVQPDLVFTHFLDDRHQDHRLLAELTWNTFRNHAVLEYEIPKFEGDLGHPNVYVPLSPPTFKRKLDTLMDCFPSQRDRTWFDPEVFQGHMRLRGVECNAPSRYAEAFHGRKLTL